LNPIYLLIGAPLVGGGTRLAVSLKNFMISRKPIFACVDTAWPNTGSSAWKGFGMRLEELKGLGSASR